MNMTQNQEPRKPIVGVVGIGMVGKEVVRHFSESGWKRGKNLLCFDIEPSKGFQDDINLAQVVFVCVPTPRAKNGSCDTSVVEAVVKKYHHPKRVLIVKSTVEPGTVARLQKRYKSPMLFNPEFLTESRAWEDFIRPDRQVVGHTAKSLQHASRVLGFLPPAFFSSPGVLGTYDFIRINSTEAEMGKYASNVFGAIKVTYANIIADFTASLDIALKREGIQTPLSYNNVRMMVAHDGRIGDAWMDVYRGSYRGFGGYCFPKDFDAFVNLGDSMVKKLNKSEDKKTKALLVKSIGVLKAIRSYNNELLKTQGLSPKLVRSHEKAVEENVKNILKNNKKNK
jgi:UDPglucose 6-dehydrogenase